MMWLYICIVKKDVHNEIYIKISWDQIIASGEKILPSCVTIFTVSLYVQFPSRSHLLKRPSSSSASACSSSGNSRPHSATPNSPSHQPPRPIRATSTTTLCPSTPNRQAQSSNKQVREKQNKTKHYTCIFWKFWPEKCFTFFTSSSHGGNFYPMIFFFTAWVKIH